VKLQLVSFEELLPGQEITPLGQVGRKGPAYGNRSGKFAVASDSINELIANANFVGDSFGELKAAVNVHGLYRIIPTKAAAE
ncbi:MAG: hypothetical protein GXP30_11070, partial [Verrucomicrobia bacterium]|nr:hypothetical protein [Verrucomicrobiota bacterium]